jgi:voltage-gated potassium channel
VNDSKPSEQQLQDERWELVRQIDRATEKPLIALSFVWLGLLVLEFTQGLSQPLVIVTYVIWGLFILDFALGFLIAPRKVAYLRKNWLTAISLLLPALRILRVFAALRFLRAARAVRSVGLVRVITSLNRGMRAIGNTLGRRGIGYVVALTIIMTFGGAAGMYAFESPAALCESQYAGEDVENARALCAQRAAGDSTGLDSYGESVWWTAMIMTTMGSEYWPRTAEGRILGWLLAVYAFAIFGYITATIASIFVGKDAAAQAGGAPAGAAALHAEIAALRAQIATLSAQLGQPPTESAAARRDTM